MVAAMALSALMTSLMQYIMNKHGLYDGVNCTINTEVAFNMMGSVFEADDSVDYTTLFEPTASEFEATGRGYIVASVGEESGEVPYTAFAALGSYLEKERETAKAFLGAVRRGYEFMCESTPAEVAKSLAPSFDGTSEESLAIAVESYLAIDAWCSTPVMTEESLVRLQEIMENAGELEERVNFDDIVDNSIAEEIMKQ